MQLYIFSLVLLGVSPGLASPPGLSEVQLERGGCPTFWFSFNGRCYKYVATHMSWANAELHCVSQNANLVSIFSLEEHNFVKSLIKNFDHSQQQTWIGLSDIAKEGAWMWTDGCPVSFVWWAVGEPNNGLGGTEHCGNTNQRPGFNWNDKQCFALLPSVCASRITCPALSARSET